MPPSPKPSRPILTPLNTSKSPSFPSELHDSPLFSGKTESIKQDDLRTPITPPIAYTDFLKSLTPVLASPSPSSAKEKSCSYPASASQPSTATSAYFCNCSSYPRRSPSSASIASSTSPVHIHHHHYHHRGDRVRKTPTSLRPLRAPTASSPKTSSPIFESPKCCSPKCCSAKSPLPPADWNVESGIRRPETPRCTSCSKPISIRRVVTRTVTYKRTNLEPAPKGKRRKTEEE